jgi:hypothetical protein
VAVVLAIALAAQPACRRSADERARDASAEGKTAAPAEQASSLGYAPAAPAQAGAAPGRAVQPPAAAAVAGAPNAANLKLIRTGQVTLEVAAFPDAADRVAELARAHGGYVAGRQSDAPDGERRRGTLTLRIPADRFDQVFSGLKGIGKLLSDKVDVQDVTKAYFDLQTRLRVKRDTEARLREILRTRTARLSDVLEAERELARVTEEIEGMEGTRRFYDEQVSFATVIVSLQEPRSVVRPGALEPVREALRESLRLMSQSAAALIYLVVFLLPWSLVLAVAVLLWRARRRRRAARTAAAGA